MLDITAIAPENDYGVHDLRTYYRHITRQEVTRLYQHIGLSQLATIATELQLRYPKIESFSFSAEDEDDGMMLWPLMFTPSPQHLKEYHELSEDESTDLTDEWDKSLGEIFDTGGLEMALDIQQFKERKIDIVKAASWEPQDGVLLAEVILRSVSL